MNRRASLAATLATAALATAAFVTLAAPPPLRTDDPSPREELARLEAFAEGARSHALQASWRELADPSARVGPPTGVLPLSWFSADDARRLGAALRDAEDLEVLSRLRAGSAAARAQADPATARAAEALRAARADRDAALDQDAIDRELLEGVDAASRREAWMRLHAADAVLAPLVREVALHRAAFARERDGNPDDPRVADRLRAQATAALAPRPGEALVDPWDAEAGDPALARRLASVLDEGRCLSRARAALTWAGLPPTPAGLTLAETRGARGFSSYATFPVAPPRDVRVMLTPGAGIPAHWSCLHEMGHAAQALLAPAAARPSRRRPASGAVSEGCAKVVERLAFAPEWLRAQGVSQSDIAALAAWERVSERARGRDILADVAFEDELNANPGADLDAAWARVRAGLAGETAPVPQAWAAERSAALEPGHRIDYLLSRCAQAAIYRRLRALPGGLLGPEAREVLRRDVLAAAAGRDYEEWFEIAAGEAPSCDAWLSDVAGT